MSPPDDPDDEDTDRRRPTAHRHRRTVPGGIPVLAEQPPEPDADFEWPDAIRAEPAARHEVSAIVRQLAARLREEFSRLLTDAPQDLSRRLGALERDFEPVRRLGRWAAGVALGAALAIGAFLYRRGADEQRVADDIKAVRDKADRCENKIDSFLTPLKEPRP